MLQEGLRIKRPQVRVLPGALYFQSLTAIPQYNPSHSVQKYPFGTHFFPAWLYRTAAVEPSAMGVQIPPDSFPFLLSFRAQLSFFTIRVEILALRQQLGVFKRKNPRPRLTINDRVFWILLRRFWSLWTHALVIVKPETVVGWHRAGFRLFWRFRSRTQNPGRPKINAEVRAVIRRMVEENATWGAPRIHGELHKLGFDVSERSVSRYICHLSNPNQAARKLWVAFLRNHCDVIAAMDFLPCQPSPSESYIVSSSSNMVAVRFSISMLRNIHPVLG
jgi:hypothetical protein